MPRRKRTAQEPSDSEPSSPTPLPTTPPKDRTKRRRSWDMQAEVAVSKRRDRSFSFSRDEYDSGSDEEGPQPKRKVRRREPQEHRDRERERERDHHSRSREYHPKNHHRRERERSESYDRYEAHREPHRERDVERPPKEDKQVMFKNAPTPVSAPDPAQEAWYALAANMGIPHDKLPEMFNRIMEHAPVPRLGQGQVFIPTLTAFTRAAASVNGAHPRFPPVVEPLDKIEGLVLVPEEESQSSTCGDLLQRGEDVCTRLEAAFVQQSKASTSYDTEIDEVMRHMVPILMTFAGDDPIGVQIALWVKSSGMLRAKLQDTLGDAQIKASDICSKVAEYLEAIQAAYAAKQKLVDEARKDFDAIIKRQDDELNKICAQVTKHEGAFAKAMKAVPSFFAMREKLLKKMLHLGGGGDVDEDEDEDEE